MERLISSGALNRRLKVCTRSQNSWTWNVEWNLGHPTPHLLSPLPRPGLAFYNSVTNWPMLQKPGKEASYTGSDQWCSSQNYRIRDSQPLTWWGAVCSMEGPVHYRTFCRTFGSTHLIQVELFLPQAVTMKNVSRHFWMFLGSRQSIESYRHQVYLA